jgi:ubiquinone/menaquinone biosynthesis C-methylase UbiE
MEELQKLFVCPICRGELVDKFCSICGLSFQGNPVASYISKEMYSSERAYADAMRVIEFWGNGWRKRLKEPDHAFLFKLGKLGLASYAESSLARCRANKTLMGVEVPFERLAGLIALNIGCGAGEEAAILALGGASCIAMDITSPAAEAADSLLGIFGRGIGVQADARFIPLKSETVDIVYSSGVLHHSSDLQKSISEIHRVLKPGGTAFIMLYATWSITFLQEKILRWSGEKDWETEGRKNPCTTTYSASQCKSLFSAFESVQINKRGASLRNVAKIGKYLPILFDKYIDGPLGANLNIMVKKAV